MNAIFSTILSMSVTASFVAVVVILVRVALKKAPKVFSYALWAVVLFRLVCPFSFSSQVSLLPTTQNPQGLVSSIVQDSNHPIKDLSNLTPPTTLNPVQPPTTTPNAQSQTPTTTPSITKISFLDIATFIWLIGIVVLLFYSVFSYIRLKRRLATAIVIQGNLFESNKIKTPFVIGLIKPKIYIPVGLKSSEIDYILKHEQTHIKRFDYLIKPFAFLVLILHWFNPLMWVCYFLMTKDMEMSCDEAVIKHTKEDIRGSYSTSLLSLSIKETGLYIPLAFGESSVKSRIKNVLIYKKPAFWVVSLAIVSIIIISFCLLANPKNDELNASFVDFQATYSIAIKAEQLLITSPTNSTSITNGSTFKEVFTTLKTSPVDWKKGNSYKTDETPLVLYVDLANNHKISFYKSFPERAEVTYKQESRCFEIPSGFYDELYLCYSVSSYAIPRQIMKAILDSKPTKQESIQDVPNSNQFYILNVGKYNFYIYQKSNKYYIEKPYQFINELTKEVYEDAIKFATNPTNENPIIQNNSDTMVVPVDFSKVLATNFVTEPPAILYADAKKIVFESTFGLVFFDMQTKKVTDSFDSYRSLSEFNGPHISNKISPDATVLYFYDCNLPIDVDEKQLIYTYDSKTKSIAKLYDTRPTGSYDKVIDLYEKYNNIEQPEAILSNAYRLNKDQFIYLRMMNGLVVDLELVIYDERTKKKSVLPVWENVDLGQKMKKTKEGMIFADPDAAFEQALVDYRVIFDIISNQWDLPPISKANYNDYMDLGWKLENFAPSEQTQVYYACNYLYLYEKSIGK